jgi:hypothetical protein
MKHLLRIIILLLFTVHCSLFTAFAQQQYLPLNNSINDIVESRLVQKGYGFHSSVKPYRISEINKYVNVDSIFKSLNINSKSAVLNELMNDETQNPKPKTQNPNSKDYITASLNLLGEGGRDIGYKKNTLQTGIGLNICGDIGKKLSFSADFMLNNSSYFHYADSLIKLTNTIPNEGKAINSHLGYFYRNFNFYLTYSPSGFFNLEIGKGKNFWGDGYRSVLLSDNTNSYPYFKITTTFWNFKYVNLFAKLTDIDAPALGIKNYKDRYTAMHYLSWNITKKFNLSFYEAVMFRGKDTTGNRGFDVNYLNPVIVYRPVEFSLGSPDNMLMGVSMNLKVAKKNMVYFQVMLDEFVLSHVRQRDGWWANKQAFQLGFKSFDIFGIRNLNIQTEYNYVRPFTYAHSNIESGYSDFNQPLALPLGANVMESVTFLHYRMKRWQMKLEFEYAKYGTDTGNYNYGQNIFKIYQTHSKEFNNKVGQGLKNTIIYTEFNVSYTVNPEANLIIEAGIINRKHSVESIGKSDNMIYFGIKTLFENRYTDF